MDNQIILRKSVTFNTPTQIINMGGPWVGELVIDQKNVIDNVVIDNLYPDLETKKLYFTRYHDVSKWKKNNFFFVYFIEIVNGSMYMYDLKFDQIFIDSVSNNNELTYFDAFHNKNPERKRSVDLNTIKCLYIKKIW